MYSLSTQIFTVDILLITRDNYAFYDYDFRHLLLICANIEKLIDDAILFDISRPRLLLVGAELMSASTG